MSSIVQVMRESAAERKRKRTICAMINPGSSRRMDRRLGAGECINRSMNRVARLMLALIVGLSLLTWVASGVVQSTVREWFERDVQSRSQLVLTGARPALADAWYDSANLSK